MQRREGSFSVLYELPNIYEQYNYFNDAASVKLCACVCVSVCVCTSVYMYTRTIGSSVVFSQKDFC